MQNNSGKVPVAIAGIQNPLEVNDLKALKG